MLLSFYNPETLGDILLVILKEDVQNQDAKIKGDVTRIFNTENNETIGFNIKNVKSILNLQDTDIGHIVLNEAQINTLNKTISDNGFEATLELDDKPRFVVGHVDEMTEHPDSDHLHVTKIDVGQEEDLQIVCGASNIEQGQNVVVALTGAVMPDGKIIWPGKLRGVESFGMCCSASELALPNATKGHGILVLDDSKVAGTAFQF